MIEPSRGELMISSTIGARAFAQSRESADAGPDDRIRSPHRGTRAIALATEKWSAVPDAGRALRHDCDHAVDVDDVLLVSPMGPRHVTALGQTESRNPGFHPRA